MSYAFLLRRATASQWTASNPILPDGQEGYETDTGQRKVGNGATAWSSLPYTTGHAAVSLTELGYLDGVTSGIQSQIGGKQDALVSGTSIKTINGTSLLGSGDLVIEGSSGASLSDVIVYAIALGG